MPQPIPALMRVALVLAAMLVISACDASSPEPTPIALPSAPPAAPPAVALTSFRFDSVPASLTLDVPDMRSIPLASFSTAALPAGVRTLATVSAPSASAQSGTGLTVQALREGTATVSVSVSAPGYRDTTLTIALVSRVTCPPASPSGAADFFPDLSAAGIDFTYRFTYSSSRQQSQGFSTDGSLRMTPVGAATCYRGTRTTPLAYVFEGVSGGTPLVRQATAAATEDSSNVVTLPIYFVSGNSMRPVVFARYGAPGAEQTIQFPVPGPGNCRTAFLLRAGAGLVSEDQGRCYRGFGSTEAWSLTRTAGRATGV